MPETIRVAAAQFHVGNGVARNLETCLRVIREAGERNPDLLVLPGFANHCSWYDSAQHCYEVSVDLDGPFLEAVAEAAAEIHAFVVINCTVRRYHDRVTGTSLMFAPNGSLAGQTNKQVLIGHESDFLDRATEAGPVIETSLGRLAMYSCTDGIMNETPRCLALRGAQVLCNSLNSFAADDGTLHVPVRAAENKVWVVAANKTGPLVPEELLQPVSAAINIPAHMLEGAGGSQIVAPDGTVVAMAGKEEEIIVADIDVMLADDKTRPDGTDIFETRRPGMYQQIGMDPAQQQLRPLQGPDDLTVAVIDADRVSDAAEALADLSSAGLVCVTPLRDAEQADGLAAALAENQLLATSMTCKLDGARAHCAVLIGADGILVRQPLIHQTERYSWSALADEVATLDTPYGRIAVITGDDAIYPETFRLLAFEGVSTALVPADMQEDWEARTGIVERAAENRINVVFASPGNSLVASLQKDFTLTSERQKRGFDGLLSAPQVFRTDSGNTLVADVHPQAANNKECSRSTDLVASRPWELVAPIVSHRGPH